MLYGAGTDDFLVKIQSPEAWIKASLSPGIVYKKLHYISKVHGSHRLIQSESHFPNNFP